MRLLLRGVRIIDPARSLDAGGRDVLIEDGVLRELGRGIHCEDAIVEDLGRPNPDDECVLCPAFIDLHAHLREPGGEDAETVVSGARVAATGGFGALVAMANTRSAIDDPGAVAAAVRRNSSAGITVLQAAAVTVGLRGEHLVDMHACAEAGAVAFSDDGRNAFGAAMLERALRCAADIDRPVLVHPEDEAMIAAAHPGTDTARCADRPPEVEMSAVRTALEALRSAGSGRLHLQHVSTAASVALLRKARHAGLGVTAEVTPHHLTLTEGARTPMHRVNPPLRNEEDREAVVHALLDGDIDAIATDHAPHTAAAKGAVFEAAAPGMTGLQTALPLALRLRREAVPMAVIVERLTTGPYRVLGSASAVSCPSFHLGRPITCTLFDPLREWTVGADAAGSSSLNTPLMGRRLHGTVLLTMVDGRVVHACSTLSHLQETANVL